MKPPKKNPTLALPGDVERVLRTKIVEARAAGVEVREGVLDCVEMKDGGGLCACALGCAVLDALGKRPFLAAMRRLNISMAQASQLVNGFEGYRPPRGPQRASKWRDVGTRLRAEFLPAVAAGEAVASMIHDLKCHPPDFAALLAGTKTHEARRADRPFAVGDVLCLREWTPATATYTGRTLDVEVTHLTAGPTYGLPPDLAVMSVTRRPAGVHEDLARAAHALSDADAAIAVALLSRLPGLSDRLAQHHAAGQVPCGRWRGRTGAWMDQVVGRAVRALATKTGGGK